MRLIIAGVLGVWSLNAAQWKRRTIYQLLTDRFALAGEDRETCGDQQECTFGGFCGGTFRGIEDHLDYIQGMGFDAIWLSPVVQNTPCGYHGYWMQNLSAIEHHFGTAQDLERLSKATHDRGIALMIDAIFNHMGPTFHYEHNLTYDMFFPFNDPAYFHGMPQYWEHLDGQDGDMDQHQREVGWLGSGESQLPDLAQENPFVESKLFEWIHDTVVRYGVDGLRLDAVPYVNKTFFQRLKTEILPDTYMVGEVVVDKQPLSYMSSYINTPSDASGAAAADHVVGPVIDAVLDYPLWAYIRQTFAQVGDPPTYQLTPQQFVDSWLALNQSFAEIGVLANFVDNHDQERWLLRSPDKRTYQTGLVAAMFLPGVPISYYGAEQGMQGTPFGGPASRTPLWEHGFSKQAELYRWTRKAVAARKRMLAGLIEANIDDISEFQALGDHAVIFRRGPAVVVLSQLAESVLDVPTPWTQGTVACNALQETACIVVGDQGTMQVKVSGVPLVMFAVDGVSVVEGGLRLHSQDIGILVTAVGKGGFRLSASLGAELGGIDNPMIVDGLPSANHAIVWNGDSEVGVLTATGKLAVNLTTHSFALYDKSDHLLATADRIVSSDGCLLFSLGRAAGLSAEPPRFFGSGQGTEVGLEVNGSISQVDNRAFAVPHFWTTDGYSALGVSELNYQRFEHERYPVNWTRTEDGGAQFRVRGGRADWYLSPAASRKSAQQALWTLTGAPPVPPRYAFGFMVSRWGWQSSQDVRDVLQHFRTANIPIDSWVSDFEWYTGHPDYGLPDRGDPNFSDFGYNKVLFPDPSSQLADYHSNFGVRFGGIRKPRLGNSALLDMARAKNWLVRADPQWDGGRIRDGGDRNLNFSIPEVRSWYQKQMAHYVADGVDFWWNDEGETAYFTTYHWTQAEFDLLRKKNPSGRFLAINRDHTLGLQRLGAAVWTGDQHEGWEALAAQATYLVGWQQAGAGYVTCDTGGFKGKSETPQLLARWYQVSVFMSIMRIHSVDDEKPHFPWLWGDKAEVSMRKSIDLRYKLLPLLYSLAHLQYSELEPVFRPLGYYHADARSERVVDQWYVGRQLMVAPVMNPFNQREVYFPPGEWYRFGSKQPVSVGPSVEVLYQVPLDEIPIYVPAGSIVPLAPVVQNVESLPGGPLEVHVYSGRDTTFRLVEDDGATIAYEQGAVCATDFVWDEAAFTLSWKRQSDLRFPTSFESLRVLVFTPDGQGTASRVVSIRSSGSLQLPRAAPQREHVHHSHQDAAISEIFAAFGGLVVVLGFVVVFRSRRPQLEHPAAEPLLA
mmetsp:Transcript_4104/g.8743  ORF Transcript_4104/g.8743 Transcript_4104/m.8743 type:complete len:1294 (+) Transcript_4104:27-3908(+)